MGVCGAPKLLCMSLTKLAAVSSPPHAVYHASMTLPTEVRSPLFHALVYFDIQ